MKIIKESFIMRIQVPSCVGKVGLLFCVPIVLVGCGGVTLSKLQNQTPIQRATTVCEYDLYYLGAKGNIELSRSQSDSALYQYNLWKINADNGYETKRQCQTIQEPYSDSERRCSPNVYGTSDCEYITVTKYRSARHCTNVHVPINIQAAYEQAKIWKRKATQYKVDAAKHNITMRSAWHKCYLWARRATPQQLIDWVRHGGY